MSWVLRRHLRYRERTEEELKRAKTISEQAAAAQRRQFDELESLYHTAPIGLAVFDRALIRAVRRLAAVGLVRQDVLDPAPKRVDSNDLVLMVAGLVRAEPSITLDGIARRLQGMGQRTPRGGLRWSRSSVKNLLDRAKEQGLVRDLGAA